MEKNTVITLFLISLTLAAAGEKRKNYSEALKKKISKVDKIIVRDGGNTCCVTAKETLTQDVYKKITDKDTIKRLISGIEFTKGRTKNSCFCCGHPGIDFYVGKERVLISSWKHGDGLFVAKHVYNFTKKSKVNVAEWLIKNEIPDDNKEFRKILKEDKVKPKKRGDRGSP